jgi:phenylalanyl-tRNA synthetase alpha chain
VLAGVGLDPARWSGLALGIGLDRALMLRKGIGDIRLLRSDDPRVAAQMLTLDRYREVSSMPPANRDISVAVPEDIDAEGIGDLTREGLLPQILESVEQVITIGETPRAALPPQAIERIGLQPGQKNVLLRLVLRHPTRTLTTDDANRIRDHVYAAIHQGTVSQWASPRDEAGADSPGQAQEGEFI